MAYNDGFYSISQYLEKPENLCDKIKAIDALIFAMELKMVDSIGTSDLTEYQLDDGQMKVRTAYRSINDLMAGIKSLEQLKFRYINRLNGRTTVLRSGKF